MNRNTFTDASIRVAALPHKNLPQCNPGPCRCYIIVITDTMLRWRCSECLHYYEHSRKNTRAMVNTPTLF